MRSYGSVKWMPRACPVEAHVRSYTKRSPAWSVPARGGWGRAQRAPSGRNFRGLAALDPGHPWFGIGELGSTEFGIDSRNWLGGKGALITRWRKTLAANHRNPTRQQGKHGSSSLTLRVTMRNILIKAWQRREFVSPFSPKGRTITAQRPHRDTQAFAPKGQPHSSPGLGED